MYGVPFTKCLYEGADCERETERETTKGGKDREKKGAQSWGLGMALGVRL